MRALPEFTAAAKFHDLRKGIVNLFRAGPYLQFAQTRKVHQYPFTRHEDELA
jgi:hypothetical protein